MRTMRAVVLDASGPPEALMIREPAPGQVRSDLPWEVLGGVGESLQTTYGSLTVCMDARAGPNVLIRGGTSSVGVIAAVLANDMGATVLATTRRADRVAVLEEHGVDHMIVDDGAIAERVRALVPNGVEAALELVGTPIPTGVRPTAYSGTSSSLPAEVLQRFLDEIAHDDMEHDRVVGKIVVRVP